jgi:hypothetical protein
MFRISEEPSDKYHGCHANYADGKGGVQVHGEKWAENERCLIWLLPSHSLPQRTTR